MVTHNPKSECRYTQSANRIRQDKLQMSTVMRSNDLGPGWAHDIPVFTGVQQTLARLLDVPVGVYVHKVFSLHIYSKDVEDLLSMEVVADGDRYMPEGIGLPGDDILATRIRANDLVYNKLQPPHDVTESEMFYRDTIFRRLDAIEEESE